MKLAWLQNLYTLAILHTCMHLEGLITYFTTRNTEGQLPADG